MCGIAGIVTNNKTLLQPYHLQQMATTLQHRGPNGEGIWMNKTNSVGFAHRRLSIIDLSEQAAQPMHKNFVARTTGALGNELSITYNGEIYNYLELREQLQKKGYHFTTQSDTEVLLALYDYYDKDCLNYLDGMFAFAIWNETTKEFFAARDRFGEKPFYYHHQNGSFYFASEMKALWAVDIAKQTNHTQLLNYLSAGLISNLNDAATTFYINIKKLPAAHYLYYDLQNDELITNCYWNLKEQIQPKPITENDAIEQLQFLLNQSVQRRLRSDVVVGTSLSGGLDSSSIVAIIQKVQKSASGLKTFSAVFPGFEKDESAYIKQVVQKFGIDSFTTSPTAKDFEADFERLLYHQEEPFQSSSIYAQYKVYELAKQNGVTVLLDGQGADETFAGYTKYYHWYWQELIRTSQFGLFQKERKATVANNHAIDLGLKNVVAALLPSFTKTVLEQKLKKQIVQNTWLTQEFVNDNFNADTITKPTIDKLNDILYYNTCSNGLEDLLRYADRNSMAHSREVRLPFLNHELVEFSFGLPSSFKIKNGFTKYILRGAMQSLLPANIVWRKDKIGFEPPQQQWLQNKAINELTEQAKQKLIANGIVKKEMTNEPLLIANAHDENNFAWWFLCAGKLL